MRKIELLSSVLVIVLASISPYFTSQAQAAVHKNIVDPATLTYNWMTQPTFEKLKKKAIERGHRTIASGGSDDQLSDDLMSPQLKEFRKNFLAVTNAQQLDDLLKKLNAEYDTYPMDLKFVAANLIPYQVFRAFVYKITPTLTKARVTHSMLLTTVKEFAAGQGVFLPTQQWAAGFQYVAEPFTSDESRWSTTADVQDYMANTVYPAVLLSAQRIQALDFSQTPVIWDNQIGYGSASFVDNIDRYRKIGEAERFTILANIHLALHRLSLFRAYNSDRFFDMAEDMGKLWGVSAFFWDPIDGATFKNRVNVMNQYPDNFSLDSQNGQKWMSTAFQHLQQFVYFNSLSWNELKDQPSSKTSFIDPGLFRPLTREATLTAGTLEDMIKGKTTVRSAITGETLVVDLPAFFTKPPQSLLSLLPTQFDETPEQTKKTFADGKTLSVRNYYWGRATGWNVSAYQPYFPSITSSADIPNATRILSQVWGGGFFSAAMAGFVQ